MKHTWNDDQIRDYLINHIKKSIIDDVGGALIGWSSQMHNKKYIAGSFAVPRMLFPEIDGLGSYITGNPKSTGSNIKTYISNILGESNHKYKEFAGFIVFIFRHGLLHQHQPKEFTHNNKQIGWEFRISDPNNPIEVNEKYHLEFKSDVLTIDANIFYRDIVNSVEGFAEDVITKYRSTFETSLDAQMKSLTKESLLKEVKYLEDTDFTFLETYEI
ncbi:MAG: hypothetical protein Q7S61_02650 [bacterium]|nr:hypothetical protein [bacterium]